MRAGSVNTRGIKGPQSLISNALDVAQFQGMKTVKTDVNNELANGDKSERD